MLKLPEMNVQTPLQNTMAKYSACHRNNLPAGTTIRTACPGGNHFSCISWLAVKDVNQQGSGTDSPQHGPGLTHLPNIQTALKSHMHSNHKLGYANSKTGYYSYHQCLLSHVYKSISNAVPKAALFGACPNLLSK